MLKFFRFPFAVAGDKTAVPDPSQVTGSVSYSQGFGPDYQADPGVDPDAKPVPRDEMNQVLFDITNAVMELQSQGVPDFITSALNGGTPYSYSKNAMVKYSDGNIYVSKINSNTSLPTVSANWSRFNPAGAENLIGEATGAADAMTVSFLSNPTAYVNGAPMFVRAFAANTSATPTINANGIGPITICKGANVALSAGDIPGSGFWMLLNYDATLNKAVLANPANGINAIGVNQSWQVLTGARASNTLYTNNSGKPIQVSITIDQVLANYTFDVNGVPIMRDPSFRTLSTITAIIPNGDTYKLTTTGPVLIYYWSELR